MLDTPAKPAPDTGGAPAPKVSFVSLGCPKALVDSERIITRLRAEGYELTREHKGSDLVIVNTCGFLDSAKAESLDAIGQALNENGKVIVTGCMGAEPENITKAHPGVLAITGPQQYESVLDAVHRAAPPQHNPFIDLVPPEGIKLTPRHYAYLKISEGCNNRCTFCIIPKLRGDLVSRPAAEVTARGRAAGEGRTSRNCWSSRRTPRPTASISNTRRVHGRTPPARRARCAPNSSTCRTRLANSASGYACTMSIPTSMSTTSSP